MKTLLIVFMLFFSIKSNGQTKKSKYVLDTTKKWSFYDTGSTARTPYFHNNAKMQAFVKSGSDTLVILDSVLLFYNHNIRYIKIGDKVYPLKP